MSPPAGAGELTFILGPPIEPEQRRAFDDYQAAMAADREQDARRYEALEREYLEVIFTKEQAGEASIFAELLGAALGAPVRVLRTSFDAAMQGGLWVVAVTVSGRDLVFGPKGPANGASGLRRKLATTRSWQWKRPRWLPRSLIPTLASGPSALPVGEGGRTNSTGSGSRRRTEARLCRSGAGSERRVVARL
jgi:hypothetical protein